MPRTKKKSPPPVLEIKDPRPRVVSIEDAAHRLGIHPDTLRIWWRDPSKFGVPPKLPKPRQLGPNRIGVVESEIDECIAALPLAPIYAGTAGA